MGVTAGCIRRDPRSLPGGWIGSMARTVGDSWTLPWWALPLRAGAYLVLSEQPGLPAYDQVGPVSSIAAVMTAAIGERPMFQGSAWVWTAVDRAPPPTIPTSTRLSECTARNAVPRHCCRRCSHGVRGGRRTLSGPRRRRRSMSREIHDGYHLRLGNYRRAWQQVTVPNGGRWRVSLGRCDHR